MNDLHTKYRPNKLDEVVGQDGSVAALRALITNRSSHAFLFTGPSGVGKTTLARIVASELGVQRGDLLEVDAASHNGINDMRAIVDRVEFKAVHGDSRACIIDEAHALSKQAWQPILKSCEEPPPHFYWFFCTTEAGKVPPTIQTRCTGLVLQPIDEDEIYDRLCYVHDKEKMKINKDDVDDILGLIARAARGSMRAALVGLASCAEAKSYKEAAAILRQSVPDKDTIEFIRFIAKGDAVDWKGAMKQLNKLGDVEPESLRITIVHYLTAVLGQCKSDEKAAKVLSMLNVFRTPYLGTTPKADLLLSIGELIYDTED